MAGRQSGPSRSPRSRTNRAVPARPAGAPRAGCLQAIPRLPNPGLGPALPVRTGSGAGRSLGSRRGRSIAGTRFGRKALPLEEDIEIKSTSRRVGKPQSEPADERNYHTAKPRSCKRTLAKSNVIVKRGRRSWTARPTPSAIVGHHGAANCLCGSSAFTSGSAIYQLCLPYQSSMSRRTRSFSIPYRS